MTNPKIITRINVHVATARNAFFCAVEDAIKDALNDHGIYYIKDTYLEDATDAAWETFLRQVAPK